VEQIGLVEAIATLRSELREAVAAAEGQDVLFPVEAVNLEFQVAVTRDLHGDGKIKFWVLEVGAGASYKTDSVHKVSLNLGPPVDQTGKTVDIRRRSAQKP
jgi:hypothetical protein